MLFYAAGFAALLAALPPTPSAQSVNLLAKHAGKFTAENDLQHFIRNGLCDKGALSGWEACVCAMTCYDCVMASGEDGSCSWLNPGELSCEPLPSTLPVPP
jgi:hypothetical protein|eukprot:COSAG01_NODE_2703_length_7225_cov_5.003368_8_plen_101_part_00